MSNPRVYDGLHYWVWRNTGDRIRHRVSKFVEHYACLMTWGRVNSRMDAIKGQELRWEVEVNQ